MKLILYVLLLWSCVSTVQNDNREHCYCDKTKKVYVTVNGVAVDSIDMKKKLAELKTNQHSKSTEIGYYHYIIQNKPCK